MLLIAEKIKYSSKIKILRDIKIKLKPIKKYFKQKKIEENKLASPLRMFIESS